MAAFVDKRAAEWKGSNVIAGSILRKQEPQHWIPAFAGMTKE